jgi:hypothetical protein
MGKEYLYDPEGHAFSTVLVFRNEEDYERVDMRFRITRLTIE